MVDDASAGAADPSSAGAPKSASDTMREAGEKARGAFLERIAEPVKRAGEAMKATGEKMQQSGSTIGLKMLDQAETNTQAAFSAMREAAQAKDLSEVMKVQGDFLREQGNRSMSQAREIGELIMQFGRDAVGTMNAMRGGQSH